MPAGSSRRGRRTGCSRARPTPTPGPWPRRSRPSATPPRAATPTASAATRPTPGTCPAAASSTPAARCRWPSARPWTCGCGRPGRAAGPPASTSATGVPSWSTRCRPGRWGRTPPCTRRWPRDRDPAGPRQPRGRPGADPGGARPARPLRGQARPGAGGPGRRRGRPRGPAGRDRRPGRRVRLRQDHPGPDHPRAGRADQRPGPVPRPADRPGHGRPQAVPPRGPAGPPGPHRGPQPAPVGVLVGGRGPAHPGVKGDEETLVADALARSGLRPPRRFFLAYPHELSGGQRQRVVIAGALALEPSMLVADEPVSSLDASVRGEILALLLGLVRDLDLSILVVTHDLGLAWNIADRLAVMYLGRIVEQGPTETVLAAPRHPYTRALLSVVPQAHHLETQILTGEPPDPTRVPGGCRFHPRCPALASGEAAQAGMDDRCRNEQVPILRGVAEHHAACFLTDESVKKESGSRVGR